MQSILQLQPNLVTRPLDQCPEQDLPWVREEATTTSQTVSSLFCSTDSSLPKTFTSQWTVELRTLMGWKGSAQGRRLERPEGTVTQYNEPEVGSAVPGL